MIADPSTLAQSNTYTDKNFVIVGNDTSLSIIHIGTLSPTWNIPLLNVLVAPHLIKNLISISKLTYDFPLSIMFFDNFLLSKIIK